MTKILNIAVDAMGGEGSPKKAIDGINNRISVLFIIIIIIG